MYRQSRSKTRSGRSGRSNRNKSQTRRLSINAVANTVTNNNSNNNNNDEWHGKRYYTVENQLVDSLSITNDLSIDQACQKVNTILEKIATRSPGDPHAYPRNKLKVYTVENAITAAIENRDERMDRYRRTMGIALLDTLLSHRLFKQLEMQYNAVDHALIIAATKTDNMKLIRYLVHDKGADPTAFHFQAIIHAARTEKDDIVAYLFKQPSMQAWDTLDEAVNYYKKSSYPEKQKLFILSLFVYYMFPLIEDTSDKKTKDRIIFMHDNYIEYMSKEEQQKINKLYAMVTQSMNRKLPSNIHKLLSTYG